MSSPTELHGQKPMTALAVKRFSETILARSPGVRHGAWSPRPRRPVRQDVGEPPVELPRAEERPPVDVGDDLRERHAGKTPASPGNPARDVDGGPVEPLAALPRGRQREQRLAGAPRREFLALLLLLRPDVGHEPGLFSGERSELTTLTTREASSTCTTPGAYSGAILTAVWAALVVAPPMRSGTCSRCASSPWRRAPSRRARA
jgi:hypothetical protein